MRFIDTNIRDFDQLQREFHWHILENFNMEKVEFIPRELSEVTYDPGISLRPGAYVDETLPGVRGLRS